ncbi:zeta toxin family protein [Chitinophaga sp. YR627]|uniref:zeta toxin family protein n=1 Tax=Chitinophaga sp. YR627 TaxID=1881041 RepID=UPI0015A5F105|nr:zeta toxin family protein [Chitinophaga sp. YR627]
MNANYARPLRDDDLVEDFFVKVLHFDYRENPRIIRKIVTSEKMLKDFKEEENTMVSTKHRDRDYVDDLKRWKLRKQIINELFTLKRPANEEEVILGAGGTLPSVEVKKERTAFILIGPPASGKSTVANVIAEREGAIILDTDYAKRKLPEFEYECGASLVRDESDRIMFGFGKNNPLHLSGVADLALENEYNIVVPKVGRTPEDLINIAAFFKGAGYKVHLTLISLKRREATIRALNRFNHTKRYVPLGYVFDQVGNDPILTYYLLKEKRAALFDSFGAITTDIGVGEQPQCIDLSGNNPAGWYEKNEERFI